MELLDTLLDATEGARKLSKPVYYASSLLDGVTYMLTLLSEIFNSSNLRSNKYNNKSGSNSKSRIKCCIMPQVVK
jgi:hypothetical protein